MSDSIKKVLGLLKLKKIDRQQAMRMINKINHAAGTTQTHSVAQAVDFNTPASARSRDIAIVGMSGLFPGADSVDEFWENLVANRSSIVEIPEDRWDWHKTQDEIYCRWGGFLNDVKTFDAPFFNISPLEAECMDPQQRLFLQEAYHAFQDAGYSEEKLNSQLCGVYVGTMHNDYSALLKGHAEKNPDVYEMTGNHSSILGARISYYLNLKGPCITIDTACSSSLVAAHMACQALENGDIDLALVGGVTLYLDPTTYEMMCKAHMLSYKGNCSTFDEGADGFVPGEGCVALVLKRLSLAQAEGDRIYGVINCSAVNQDGRTNGITAPSGLSQKSLISRLYKKNNINPETISYVEAHGTGTKLGDPIEVEALIEAFDEFTQKEHFCAIGSVKSNVGHTSAAAGMTSLVKVLKSFEHDLIPASIHYTNCNSHINLEHSPFYVADKNLAWDSQPGQSRMATVSSFGFSGTNAHMVVSDYISERRSSQVDGCYLFPFSAKTTTSLVSYLNSVIGWLDTAQHVELVDIAFTLSHGRTHYEKRIAMIAGTRSALIKQLRSQLDILADKCDAKQNVSLNSSTDTSISDETVALESLASKYCRGDALDFTGLPSLHWGRITSMPLYEFDKKSYWADKIKFDAIAPGRYDHPPSTPNIPALQCAPPISIEQEQAYIKGHQIDGEFVVPIALYIDWLNANLEIGQGIEKIVAVKPVNVGSEPVVLTMEYGATNGFCIFSSADPGQAVVKGYLSKDSKSDGIRVDINSIKNALPNWVGASTFYSAYIPSHIRYGDNYQCVQEIKYGASEFLASVGIRQGDDSPQGSTCVLDAVLHTVLCIEGNQPFLPGAVEGIYLERDLPQAFYVYGRRLDGNGGASSDRLYAIDIYSLDGDFIGTVKKLSLYSRAEPLRESSEILYYRPEWQQVSVSKQAADGTSGRHIILAGAALSDYLLNGASKRETDAGISRCSSFEELIKAVDNILSGGTTSALVIDLNLLYNARPELYLISLIKLVNKIIELSASSTLRVLLVNAVDIEDIALVSATEGFCRAVRKEASHIQIGLVDINISLFSDATQWLDRVENECSGFRSHAAVRYQADNRYIRHYTRASLIQPESLPLGNGVFVITGGLGALGYLVAKHLLSISDVTVALVCRSRPEGIHKERFDALLLQGGASRVKIFEVDLSNDDAVYHCFNQIIHELSAIRGIVHCAGVTHDSLIRNKQAQEVTEVVASKVNSLINMKKAMSALTIQPDYIVLYSSIAAAVGNIGQCDYAFANSYLDAFVEHHNEPASSKIISINWPLWQSDGMQSEGGHVEQLAAQFGIETLDVETGLKCFDAILASSESNVCVLKGDAHKIPGLFEESVKVAPKPIQALPQKRRYYTALSDVKQAISRAIKTKVADIEDCVGFETLGVDSISMVNITYDLERSYGELPKTLFFEYKRVSDLATYLAALSPESDIAPGHCDDVPVQLNNKVMPHDVQAVPLERRLLNGQQADSQAIAIIGVAGEYPGADNLDDFWEVLKQGKDAISEIPSTRWDINRYLGNKGEGDGKSYGKWGGFINDAFKFDPMFFGISPREAERMDPQERRLLECSWSALENASCTLGEIARNYARSVGVFVGVMNNDFILYNTPSFIDGVIPGLGSSVASIANRISYVLDFAGPSLAIDTMCSSSLTSIHLACESLLRGECRLALAGGVNLLLHPAKYSLLAQSMFLSDDGRCRSFGEGGDGYVPGEGVGMFVLKPLSEAIDDGDYIHAVIRATAIGHGGKTNGYTVPSPVAQKEMIERAIAKSGLDPNTISYVEAHGTGTALGDPIETEGLRMALGCSEARQRPLVVGSVKSNIGHLESAAGVAALTKVILQMKHHAIAPSLHSEHLNGNIDFLSSGIVINQSLQPWIPVQDSAPLRAGISSFGAGGSNAHLIVESYDNMDTQRTKGLNTAPIQRIIALSAKSSERLVRYAEDLRDYLNENDGENLPSLDDIAYSLLIGREHFSYRLLVIASDIQELLHHLDAFVSGEGADNLCRFQTAHAKSNYSDFVTVFGVQDQLVKTIDASLGEGNYYEIAKFWCDGLSIPWHETAVKGWGRKIPLPGYPFECEHYYIPAAAQLTAANAGDLRNQSVAVDLTAGTGQHAEGAGPHRIDFAGRERLFTDHVVNGDSILSGAAILLEIHAYAKREWGRDDIRFKNILFSQPVFFSEKDALYLHVERSNDEFNISVFYYGDGDYKECMSATLVFSDGDALGVENLSLGASQKLDPSQIYDEFTLRGIAYGDAYRVLDSIDVDGDSVRAGLLDPTLRGGGNRIADSVANLDAGFQSILPSLIVNQTQPGVLYLPYFIQSLDISGDLANAQSILVRECGDSVSSGKTSIAWLDGAGNLLALMSRVRIKRLKSTADNNGGKSNNWVSDFVREVFSDHLRIPLARLAEDKHVDELGIDSVVMTQLIAKLEKRFGELPKTLLFEYQTLDALTRHLERRSNEAGLVAETESNHTPRRYEALPAKYTPIFSRRIHQGECVEAAVDAGKPPIDKESRQDIAIVGLNGRFPKAGNIDEFWCNLRDGVDCISEIPTDRFGLDTEHSGQAPGTRYHWGGILDDVDKFDSLLFNIPPNQAAAMDPQERLCLESAWATLEDAGYSRSSLAGAKMGVYAGVMYEEYQLYSAISEIGGEKHALSGSAAGIANRISYFFDFRGPSLSVDTMCSSSLYAIHMACNAIRNGECESALAGGVNLILHNHKHEILGENKFLSPDGRCKAFAAGGEGYVPSEGVGFVLLKPLSDAKKDGDHIYGIIKGSAVNHGGRTSGYTVPNPVAQADVIEKAFEDACVSPRRISYVEAHGTGTSLGDPIEISGLNSVFNKSTGDKQFCAIGSVKSNIGHCESASGIAALAKVLMQMKHGMLAPSIHSQCVNSEINFENSPFVLHKNLADWPDEYEYVNGEKRALPKIAGISSFGAGGSNAHLIVEEYLYDRAHTVVAPEMCLFPLSARTEGQLSTIANDLYQLVLDRTLQMQAEDNDANRGHVDQALRSQVMDILGELLCISPSALDDNTSLSEYGLDPVQLRIFSQQLLSISANAHHTEEISPNDTVQEIVARFADNRLEDESAQPDAANSLLPNLAYTLQMGREPLAKRVLIAARSGRELLDALSQLADGCKSAASQGLFYCDDMSDVDLHRYFSTRSDAAENSPAKAEDWTQVSSDWLAGKRVDWRQLHQGHTFEKMSLPTYPFEKRRCWFSVVKSDAANVERSPVAGTLGPLLGKNISTFDQQKFSTIIQPQDPVARDHVVMGKHIFPGAAYIEMAREAVAYSHSGSDMAVIRNISWRKPIEVPDNGIEVFTRLSQTANSIKFHIYTCEGIDSCSGEFLSVARGDMPRVDRSEFVVDHGASKALDQEQVYDAFQNVELTYGPSFRGIRSIETDGRVVKSHLVLDQYPAEHYGQCTLSPLMLDGVFQSTIGLFIDGSGVLDKTYLPIGIKELAIFDTLPSQAICYIKRAEGSKGNTLIAVDVLVENATGKPLLSIKGLSLRLVEQQAVKLSVPVTERYSFKLAEEVWVHSSALNRVPFSQGDTPPKVIVVSPADGAVQGLDFSASGWEMEHWVIDEIVDAGNYRASFQKMAELLKSVISRGDKATRIVVVCRMDEASRVLGDMLAAAFRTARMEYSALNAKVIYIGSDIEGSEAFKDIVTDEIAFGWESEFEVRYGTEGAYRQIRRLKWNPDFDMDRQPTSDLAALKGVIWVTGGLGGLGKALVESACSNPDAQFVISGRSELNDSHRGLLDQLTTAGGRVDYVRCDVSKADDVKQAVAEIARKYGDITSVIHCAGVTRDSMIVNKSIDDMEAVLTPKIDGIINLDRFTCSEPLEQFIVFSSLASVTGNMGQLDYSAANAFLDSFCAYRSRLIQAGERSGQSISISWPLWDSEGMNVDSFIKEMIRKKYGLIAIPLAEGFAVFDAILARGDEHPIPLYGDIKHISSALNIAGLDGGLEMLQPLSHSQPQRAQHDRVSATGGSLFSIVRDSVANVLGLTGSDLDDDAMFSEYGVDSIQMISIMEKLEAALGQTLDPNALLDYPTIQQLVGYLQQQGVTIAPQAAGTESVDKIDIASQDGAQSAITEPDKVNTLPSIAAHAKASSRRVVAPGDEHKVAVIACSGRFPGAADIDEFWLNLKDKRDLFSHDLPERWSFGGISAESKSLLNASYTTAGAYLSNVEYFDAGLFGIGDDEAKLMDPQQRIVIELTQELFDRAGYSRDALVGRNVEVHIGAKESPYIHNNLATLDDAASRLILVGGLNNMVAGRVSHQFNLTGESKTIDTACSSSLVAINDACQSVLSGRCEAAIAGGVFVMIDPYAHMAFSKAGVLSRDGRAAVFDQHANGFVLGEAAGLVMLKRLDKALADSDQVLAVINGSAVNNDGHMMGVTVPNQSAQKSVIQQALERGHVDPSTISLYEAHGTGTLLGDPIEVKAASEVYRDYTDQKGFCAIGSVKSNIGHTITAAGVASFIKVVLAMQHNLIPATLNCSTPHPRFSFAQSPFSLALESKQWRRGTEPRRAAISSFGFGGTNIHMILEDGPIRTGTEHVRQSLPKRIFNRNRYWFGMEPDHRVNKQWLADIVGKVKRGEMDLVEAETLIVESPQLKRA